MYTRFCHFYVICFFKIMQIHTWQKKHNFTLPIYAATKQHLVQINFNFSFKIVYHPLIAYTTTAHTQHACAHARKRARALTR